MTNETSQSPSPQNLPDATPLRRERASEVIQIGYLSGLIIGGREPHLDRAFVEHPEIARAISSDGVKALRQRLQTQADSRDRSSYIELFLDEVTASAASNTLAEFITATHKARRHFMLPAPVAHGLIALHCFNEDVLVK